MKIASVAKKCKGTHQVMAVEDQQEEDDPENSLELMMKELNDRVEETDEALQLDSRGN